MQENVCRKGEGKTKMPAVRGSTRGVGLRTAGLLTLGYRPHSDRLRFRQLQLVLLLLVRDFSGNEQVASQQAERSQGRQA